jgi:hypothetical protein
MGKYNSIVNYKDLNSRARAKSSYLSAYYGQNAASNDAA